MTTTDSATATATQSLPCGASCARIPSFGVPPAPGKTTPTESIGQAGGVDAAVDNGNKRARTTGSTAGSTAAAPATVTAAAAAATMEIDTEDLGAAAAAATTAIAGVQATATASASAASGFRDASEAPLRKLSVNLIHTYGNFDIILDHSSLVSQPLPPLTRRVTYFYFGRMLIGCLFDAYWVLI